MTLSVHDTLGGGQFLTQPARAEEVFIREDLTEEQRMFGQTAAEFMRHEVLPREEALYAHDWTLTRELLRKAASLDLTRLEIPAMYGGLELDKISAAYVGEQISVNPSFAGSLGAHTSIGTLPLVLLRYRRAENAIPPEACERGADWRLRADRARSGLRRAGRAHDGAPLAGWPPLPAQWPEDVDHQRRLCRPLHRFCQGGR